MKTVSTLAEVKSKGLDVKEGSFTAKTPVSALRLQGDNGAEFWLAFNNFYVITTYNRSTLYAMAVFQLSQALKEAHSQLNNPPEVVEPTVTTPVTVPNETPVTPAT